MKEMQVAEAFPQPKQQILVQRDTIKPSWDGLFGVHWWPTACFQVSRVW